MPTESDYTQRPYLSGNEELIVEAAPAVGVWHIGLRAYAPFTGVNVVLDYDLPEDPDADQPNETLSQANLADTAGNWRHFTVKVYDVATLQIELAGGEGDADLYVKYAEQPEETNWDYRPFNFGNDERVTITNATPGTWHISIHTASDYSNATLTVTYPE